MTDRGDFMDIAVLIKQVPDTDEVKMDPETGTMVRDGVGSIINPLDLNALEAAVKLKQKAGGTVTTITMGPPQADIALRETIAMGADQAILLSDRTFAGGDTWATARTLTTILEQEGPFDLILAGEKATDGETGQVGPEVATLLGISFTTYVSGIEREGDSVTIRRTVEEGIQVQNIPFPCLLTVVHDLNDPGMPTLAGKKKGRRQEIRKLGMEDLGLERHEVGLQGSPTRVVRISHPKVTRKTEFFSGRDLEEGVGKVVSLLREKGLV